MSVAPGWHKDPADPTTQRWWDGEGWVGDPLPADATPPPGPPPATSEGEGEGTRDPQVPAVPGMPGSAEPGAAPPDEAPAEPDARPRWGRRAGPDQPSTGQASARTPPGWPYRRPAQAQPPTRPHGYTVATIGSRVVARLVDIGIVFALNVLVNGWFVYQFWTEISPVFDEAWRRAMAGESMSDLPQVGDQAGTLQIVIMILAAALWFAYEVPAIANTGQTVGKRLLRIKVVRLEANQPLGFGRSFRRWNPMGVPTLLWWCFGIGFLLQLVDVLFALFDRPLQQALHDKSAHTAVVSIAASASESSTEESSNEPADSP